MNSLNTKQRTFLEYLQTHHKSVGYPLTIQFVLKSGKYSDYDASLFLTSFKKLRAKEIQYEVRYGKLKKYING